jgi:hypothetical protein
MRDIVDAHVGESPSSEQLDGNVGDVLWCRRATPANPRLRQHQTCPSIAALDAILWPERFINVES